MLTRRALYSTCLRRYTTRAQNPIPASFLRGGTSKGIYLNRSDLPEDVVDWQPIFLGIMGSPDTSKRQLNGMGGGISSLSKICVVGKSDRSDADVDYTFAQVGIDDPVIDYSGNCGNLSTMIGVFALDNALISAPDCNSTVTVRAYNTNTSKLIDTTFPMVGGVAALDIPDLPINGITKRGSAITMEFLNPSGARTGKLLPSGKPVDTLHLPSTSFDASLVDATNPTVFVDASRLGSQPFYEEVSSEAVEQLRQAGARKMGLDPSAQAQPKIAFIRPGVGDADLEIQAFSMGVLHKAVPMTVALCLGVAANVPGTIAHAMMQKADAEGVVKIRHPGGLVSVGARVAEDGSIQSAKVLNTGRRLMKGVVWW